MYAQVIPYRERIADLRKALRENGSLGLLLIDVSELAQVEHDYGSKAFDEVLSMATKLVLELQGDKIRSADILAVNEKGGDAFLVFLSSKREEREGRTRVADLATAAKRVEEHLNRRLARLTSPYIRGPRKVTVGFGMVFFNPLVMEERLVARLVEEAWESVRIRKTQVDFENRCMVQELLLSNQIRTVFQPVVDLRSNLVLGWEALSRGPSGTDNQSPLNMFESAEKAHLEFELDRHCRQTALASAGGLPPDHKLFLNMFPASMWDPDLQGTGLIEMLGKHGLGPDRIVLEISEKYAIRNYKLFVDAMKTFTNMRFEVAVDDIGAGHSGLEKIAELNPQYLKLDMGLVKDIDTSYIRRETARIVKNFAEKADAAVIAEGIERDGELEVVQEMGIEYGQGWLLGRPADGFQVPTLARVAGDETK